MKPSGMKVWMILGLCAGLGWGLWPGLPDARGQEAEKPAIEKLVSEFDGQSPNGQWLVHPLGGKTFKIETAPGLMKLLDANIGDQNVTRKGLAIDPKRQYAIEAKFTLTGAAGEKDSNSFAILMNVAGPEGETGPVSTWAVNVDVQGKGPDGVMRMMGFKEGRFTQLGQRKIGWGRKGVQYTMRLEVNTDAAGKLSPRTVTVSVMEGMEQREKFEIDYARHEYQPDYSKPVRIGVNGHLTDWEMRDFKVEYLGTKAMADPVSGNQRIKPLGADGKELNLDFEEGTLRGWTAEGKAFEGQPIKGDTPAKRGKSARQQGQYWIGTYEVGLDGPQGRLTSEPFAATQPYASFLVGGGSDKKTRVEIVEAEGGKVILAASGAIAEEMHRVVVDLRKVQGKRIFIRIIDEGTAGWGHVNFDDFVFHPAKPNLPAGAGGPPLQLDEVKNAGLTPSEAAAAMTTQEGFKVELIAGEPQLHQPVAMAMDERGRLWVVEAFCYPKRREKGLDNIIILEDKDGDGRFETRKVFASGLNLVSGIEVGFGGVWVGAAPYLLFIPDKNGDDIPDGEPEVLLDGWGWQDTHETLNAFIWGPDGWLYGCHGVFTHSNVGKPGDPEDKRVKLNAGVWRYHPTKRLFEVFAHGTSNPWGVDFNDQGQAFITACVIPHLFHMVQGGSYIRQSGRHFSPYVYREIDTIADHRHYLGANPHGGNNRSSAAGGGHAHCGAMIYLGDSFPARFRNQLFVNNLHGNRVNIDSMKRRGSGYIGSHEEDFLLANDQWFRGINLKYDASGSVYLIDWYDKQACHRVEPQIWDRTNGRLYRVSFGEHKPVKIDLRKASDEELVKLQLHANDWHVRMARRILQERGPNPAVHAMLKSLLAEQKDETRQLRALWALHATGGLTEAAAIQMKLLEHRGEFVRAWTIQCLGEQGTISAALGAKLQTMSRQEGSPVVRLYLASLCQRLAPAERWGIIEGLSAHSEDETDVNIPTVLWNAAEPLVTLDAKRAMALAKGSQIASLTDFIYRRAAVNGGDLGPLLAAAVEQRRPAYRAQVLEQILATLRTRAGAKMPEDWAKTRAELMKTEDERVRRLTLELAVAFGDKAPFAELRATAADAKAAADSRKLALELLVRGRDEQLPELLKNLLADPAMRAAALRGLASYDSPGTAEAVLGNLGAMSGGERLEAVTLMSSRKAWAIAMLEAVKAGKWPRADLSAITARQLRGFDDKTINGLLNETWGVVRESGAETAQKMEQYKKALTEAELAKADLSHGRAVFARTCMACHSLFEIGGKIGPDITGSNRANLDYILHSIIDPNALVGKDYQLSTVVMKDGRVVAGMIREENDSAMTVQTVTEATVLERGRIASVTTSPVSMMPPGLLDTLKAAEARDLIAYLASPRQVPMKALPENAGLMFSGRDLTMWSGDPALWKVEDGEIVGKTEKGIGHNSFLISHLTMGDFKLSLKIKLVGNQGNSGIQFRSAELPKLEVKGYQADAGKGWWGKLYEENGRALLWDQSGEKHVKNGEWNEYVIEARGSRIRTWINGQPCVDLDDPKGARQGVVALQLHSGGPTEVRFKDFKLEVEAPGAPAALPAAGGK